jgi:large subunit ribosomal protein L9
MKILLLKDVYSVGRAGDVKDVADGYFRNFLLPRQLAKIATVETLKEVDDIRKQSELRMSSDRKFFEDMLETLKTQQITLFRKANDEGNLFGSITPKDILVELEKLGYKGLEERFIFIDPPIKTVSTHQVTLRPAQGIEGVIEIIVEKSA